MYIRKAEVYNRNKENPNVIGLECDIFTSFCWIVNVHIEKEQKVI